MSSTQKKHIVLDGDNENSSNTPGNGVKSTKVSGGDSKAPTVRVRSTLRPGTKTKESLRDANKYVHQDDSPDLEAFTYKLFGKAYKKLSKPQRGYAEDMFLDALEKKHSRLSARARKKKEQEKSAKTEVKTVSDTLRAAGDEEKEEPRVLPREFIFTAPQHMSYEALRKLRHKRSYHVSRFGSFAKPRLTVDSSGAASLLRPKGVFGSRELCPFNTTYNAFWQLLTFVVRWFCVVSVSSSPVLALMLKGVVLKVIVVAVPSCAVCIYGLFFKLRPIRYRTLAHNVGDRLYLWRHIESANDSTITEADERAATHRAAKIRHDRNNTIFEIICLERVENPMTHWYSFDLERSHYYQVTTKKLTVSRSLLGEIYSTLANNECTDEIARVYFDRAARHNTSVNLSVYDLDTRANTSLIALLHYRTMHPHFVQVPGAPPG
jgi:hypothetical protein